VLVLPAHLLTALHAALDGQHWLSRWLVLQTFAAVNFWRQPALGARRNVDILCTTTTSLWFTQIGLAAGGWPYLLAPFACFLLSWACTYSGHDLMAMRLWVLLHVSVFGSTNVVLWRASPAATPSQAGLLAAVRCGLVAAV
jgi:hypothetical protein